MNSKKFQKILAGVLGAGAVLLFISIIAGASGVKGGMGSFLVSSFHFASLYIPLYLLVCVYALLNPGCYKLIAGLNLSLLPFLTLTLFFHVVSGNTGIFPSRVLIYKVGILPSALFLFLLTAVEAALVFKLGNFLFPEEQWFPSRRIPLPEFNSLVKKIRTRFFEKTTVKETGETEDSTEQNEMGTVKREIFPFPDLPAPLEPMEGEDDSEIQSLISSVLRPEIPVPERTFDPEKTLDISDVVDLQELEKRPFRDTPDQGDVSDIPEESLNADLPVCDPGIDFLLGSRDEELPSDILPEGSDTEEEFPPEDLPEEDYDEEPVEVLSFPREPLSMEREVDFPENHEDYQEDYNDADDEEYEQAGYMSDRLEDLDPWRTASDEVDDDDNEDSIESHSVGDKLSPAGETEKLGTISKGLPPRHKRKQKYEVPVAGLLKEYPDKGFDTIDDDTRRAARALEETLQEFNIDAKVTGISKGPVITMFEIQPAPGVKVSRIVNLQDNLALSLAASRIRMVAPIPGKQAIGIEVPNKKRAIVSFSELVNSEDYSDGEYEVPVILGKDISGGNQVIDLARTPHLLIAGSTGSGKSVCVNSLICSILFKKSPRDVKLMMVDPKIVELKLYNDIPHLLTPVITEPKRAFQAVQWCLYEMERRYSLLDAMGVRDIKSYNRRIKERDIATTKLPYIVLVIDEFADLMATSGKELEGIVARLAAMSRAVGIHLVLATQRPSIDVITGLIKANFPSRIAFMVASKTDSRIIIDMMGAEKLLGKGDMLFTSAWDPFPSRMQGSFLSEDEVERVVSYVKTLGEPEYIDDEIFLDEEDDYSGDAGGGDSSFSDPLYNKSLDIVLQAGKASASYLQRRLKIGYNRAARLVEEMEIRGIVGPQNGSKPREVVHIPDNSGSRVLNDEE